MLADTCGHCILYTIVPVDMYFLIGAFVFFSARVCVDLIDADRIDRVCAA